jgi:hypothetical protein
MSFAGLFEGGGDVLIQRLWGPDPADRSAARTRASLKLPWSLIAACEKARAAVRVSSLATCSLATMEWPGP